MLKVLKMEMESDFFSFRSKFVSSNVQANAMGLKAEENQISDYSKLIEGRYDELIFPIIFKQQHGKIFTDILDTGWPSLYLISDKMKDILEENFLTGWKTFKIKFYDKYENVIYGYNGFSVVGRSRPTNYENSKIIEKKNVPSGQVCRYYKGVSFDAWDRKDFFIPENTHHIFITKKAAKILKNDKITNLRLENLTDSEMNIRDLQGKIS